VVGHAWPIGVALHRQAYLPGRDAAGRDDQFVSDPESPWFDPGIGQLQITQRNPVALADVPHGVAVLDYVNQVGNPLAGGQDREPGGRRISDADRDPNRGLFSGRRSQPDVLGIQGANGSQVSIGQFGDHVQPRRIGDDERIVGERLDAFRNGEPVPLRLPQRQ